MQLFFSPHLPTPISSSRTEKKLHRKKGLPFLNFEKVSADQVTPYREHRKDAKMHMQLQVGLALAASFPHIQACLQSCKGSGPCSNPLSHQELTPWWYSQLRVRVSSTKVWASASPFLVISPFKPIHKNRSNAPTLRNGEDGPKALHYSCCSHSRGTWHQRES